MRQTIEGGNQPCDEGVRTWPFTRYLTLHPVVPMMPSRISLLLLLLLLTGILACSAASEFDPELRAELLQIRDDDQLYRSGLGAVLRTPGGLDSLAQAWGVPKEGVGSEIARRQAHDDSINLVKIIRVIEEVGYPGSSLVGDTANEAAFYVLQHAPLDILSRYFPLVREAAEGGEIPLRLAAMMEDRLLMYQGRPQKYGTQVRTLVTAEGERLRVVWPIEAPAEVNRRRAEAGFELSVEENAKRLGLEYEPHTIEALEALTGEDFGKE